MVTASASAAVAPAPEELAQKDEWVRQNLLSHREGGPLPFSFAYGASVTPSGCFLSARVARKNSGTVGAEVGM